MWLRRTRRLQENPTKNRRFTIFHSIILSSVSEERRDMKCIQVIVTILLLFSVSIYSKQRKRKYSLENDVLEKSEVILKYPTYALKMPPIITSRKRMSSKVDPELSKLNNFIQNRVQHYSRSEKKCKKSPNDFRFFVVFEIK